MKQPRETKQLSRKNIAGRLPEKSRNSFADLKSQKINSKKDRPKKSSFH